VPRASVRLDATSPTRADLVLLDQLQHRGHRFFRLLWCLRDHRAPSFPNTAAAGVISSSASMVPSWLEVPKVAVRR